MRRALILLAGLGLVFALVPSVAAAPVGVLKAADLYAGQTTDVGDIYVWNDATKLYVEIDLAAGWCMTESHVAVASAVSGIPQTATGNPIPGKFAEGDKYDPCEDGDTFEFALSGFDTTPVIAVHAKVWEKTLSYATIVSNAGTSNPVAFAETYPNFGAPVDAVVPAYAPGSWPTIPGASYISNQAPGDPFNVNRWRRATETLAVPGWPVGGELWVNSDNYEFTKLNGTEIQRDDDGPVATVENTAAEPTPLPNPQTWTTIEHLSFMPKMGDNTFQFVFRNSTWEGCCGFPDNPSGLIYKAKAAYYAHSESAWGGIPVGNTQFTGANWATYFGYTVVDPLLETVTVPATNPNGPAGATSTTVLTNGAHYLFKVTGTVTWTNRNGTEPVDAECTLEVGHADWEQAATGYPDGLLELQVNSTDVDWTPVGAANGVGCAAGHEYTLPFTGAGAAVNFRIYDGVGNVQDPGWFGDNAGSLTVQIWRVFP